MKKVTAVNVPKASTANNPTLYNFTQVFPFVATVQVSAKGALELIETLTEGTLLIPKKAKPCSNCNLSVTTAEGKAIGTFEWSALSDEKKELGEFGPTQNRVITDMAPYLIIKAAKVVPLSARRKGSKYGLVYVLVDFDTDACKGACFEIETVPYQELCEGEKLTYEFYARDKAVQAVWDACKAAHL